jgi:hypothetical protein
MMNDEGGKTQFTKRSAFIIHHSAKCQPSVLTIDTCTLYDFALLRLTR